MAPHLDVILDVSGVERTFGDGTVAVRNLSIQARRGEFVSVVGPSGCGKSTLLRLAAGLEIPSIGTVRVSPGRVGFVFQDATLLPWRSVRRNVELLAELDGVPRAERRRRADEAIRLVGLQGFEGVRPRALSGGMRMRASLARSLVLEPDLFLFDEPFGALDELSRERLNGELLALHAARGFTGVLVTHSVTEAVHLGNRVVVMSSRPGRVIGDVDVPFGWDRPAALRFDAAFTRTAGVVSEMLREAVHQK